ncbi:hypothetical protein BGZ67_008986 [Mortierella alpina]|nr:hypothetical protein BGZ67_008986 [Mortierella alpina]
MAITMSLQTPHLTQDRRASLPHLNIHSTGPASSSLSASPRPKSKNRFLTDEERAAFIVASSTRRPSLHQHFSSPTLSSPPSASYSSSSSSSTSSLSSAASSPGEANANTHLTMCTTGDTGSNNSSAPASAISPILNPFQWTSDLRQYIMTDIGPQPSNSEMPTLRSHSHLVRQRSCSKISPTCLSVSGAGSAPGSAPASAMPESLSTTAPVYVRRPSLTDLCTIPQDEVLPPMDVPLEKRFAHEEWDDDDD